MLKKDILCAEAEVAELSRFSASSVQNMLDKLLDGGYISPVDYVKRLPFGSIIDRESLLEEINKKTGTSSELNKESEDLI